MRCQGVILVVLLAEVTEKALGVQSVDSKYDFGTTIFSPKGRIYQVEYASEAVNRARPAIGLCTHEGVVLCSLKTIYDTQLQVGDQHEKTSIIDAHVICACAGLTADAMVLVKDCRATSQQHTLTFQEPIPVQKLATHVADVKQAYTQHGGLRPWGVSMLLAGWDGLRGLQLYKTEPSGNFGAFKAVAVGAGASRLSAELASAYREAGEAAMGLAEAVRLVARVLSRELQRRRGEEDMSAGKASKHVDIGMEIATLAMLTTEESGATGRDNRGPSVCAYIYSDVEVENILSNLDRRDQGGYGEGSGDHQDPVSPGDANVNNNDAGGGVNSPGEQVFGEER